MTGQRRLAFATALVLGGPGARVAQADAAALAPAGADTTRKEARAVRIQGTSPEIDGRLDEPVWQVVPVITEFLQKRPAEGAAPSERTEVRIAYDDEALYVGARLYNREPGAIRAPVTPRDDAILADAFIIALDTYLDRRTAYSLGLTSAGVRLDWYQPADHEHIRDRGWDPVWQGATQLDSLGWTAEMRIPFSQLRFSPRDTQVWGLNLKRWIPGRQEEIFWVVIPTDVEQWASRFGTLLGIEGVRPSRRIELLPYVASEATLRDEIDSRDPFAEKRDAAARVGADFKMGLGPNVTLQATINPDFGQVEADPAEVNLSAYETFFPERRPFFIEGSQLLEGFGPAYFYSRRIGAAPFGAIPGEYQDRPTTSTILGAAKLTGRLPTGTSIGALAALTGEERAEYYVPEDDRFGEAVVAPRTWFGVARGQQEFGAHASTAGITLTGVHRELAADDPLAAQMNGDAITGGADWNLRFARGTYQLYGQLGFSHVSAESTAIQRLQLSSARYFQRPDATHVAFDPSRTTLSGWTGALSARKTGGGHWLGDVTVIAESPGFELNDAGILGNADNIFAFARLGYQETQPGDVLRSWNVNLSSENAYNFGGIRNFAALRSDASITWKNFWRSDHTAWIDFRSLSDDLTRGGPLIGTGHAWVVINRLASSSAANTRWNARVYYGESELGERTYRLSGGLAVRPGPRWQLSIDPNYLRSDNPRQYIRTLSTGPAATYGRRYVFSFVDRSTMLAQVRLNYTIQPDLTLDLYAEPFAASGRFHRFGELPAPRSRDLTVYGETPGTDITSVAPGEYRVTAGADSFTLQRPDFNVLSFRSNLVLRWEWRPGSTLYAVWQEDRSGLSPTGDIVGPHDLFDTFDAPGNHRFALKVNYWLPLR